MRRTVILWAACQAGCSLAQGATSCKLALVANLPITMNSLRPTIPTKINGKDAQFLLDSGAFYSIISSAAAVEYNLKTTLAPYGYRIEGIGGSADVSVATVKEFTIVGSTIKNVEFLVGGSDVSSVGVLGQNLLQKFDVEYDLASGAIRLFHTDDCDKALLAYWVKSDQAYSSMHVDKIDPSNPHTIGLAYINGKEIRVAFDTGAFTSLLSTTAAARAGVKPDSPGVVDAGYSGGLGRGRVKTYIAPFASFKIGDGEEIKNTKLRIADIDLRFADMLLGADFFISHRIFVANKEHRLYLTYNGGPVFNLSTRAAGVPATEASTDAPAKTDPSQPAATIGEATSAPTDAAAIARHGSALAARRDYVAALAELTKAVDLSPNEPEYYFQRANAYLGDGKAELALSDFDHVIALNREFLPAYIPRAELKLAKKDMEGALADLTTVEQLAAKPADLRFMLAELYQTLDHFPAAIAQYTLWINYHPDDSRLVSALQGRCMSSALQNQDLGQALSDCNTALRRADKKNLNSPHLLVDRGFVRLRLGDYSRALDDFNDAVKAMPGNALAFYGRSVAESRNGAKVASDNDLAAARKMSPKLIERFQKIGIVP